MMPHAEPHETDPAENGDGFMALEEFLHTLPLKDSNAMINLCCRLCSAYERKAFRDGLQYDAFLIMELTEDIDGDIGTLSWEGSTCICEDNDSEELADALLSAV